MADFKQAQPLFIEISRFLEGRPEATDYSKSKYRKLATTVLGEHVFNLLKYELNVANVDVRGMTVFDAGCGCGWYSVMLSSMGAQVKAVDFFPENITALGLVAEKFHLPIEAWHGDAARTALESNSVDFIYCTEAISHFHDWRAFVQEAARILGANGVALIADGNNGANPWVRAAIYRMWLASECGPFTPNRFVPGSNTPYLFRRWMIIRRAFPAVTDEEVFQLGMHTYGLGGEQLLAACRNYLNGGRLPSDGYRRGVSQSRPEDGQRTEEPVDPFALERCFRELGVPATTRPHFGFARHPILPTLNRLGAIVPRASLVLANRYIVIARKSAGSSAPSVG